MDRTRILERFVWRLAQVAGEALHLDPLSPGLVRSSLAWSRIPTTTGGGACCYSSEQ